MSSILKALKKLEGEVPPGGGVPSSSKRVDVRKAVLKRVRRVKGEWLLNRVLLGLLAGTILLVGTWMLLGRGPAPDPEPSSEETRTASLAADSGADREPVESPRIERPMPPSPGPMISGEAAQPEAGPVELQEAPPAPAPETEPPAAIDPARLKLEAVVWSNKAGKSFVVINGRILRAGDTIDGASITEIGRDFVTLEAGAQFCRLRFREE